MWKKFLQRSAELQEKISEKPYDRLYTSSEILEFAIFLPFNILWEFLIVILVFICYIQSTILMTFGILLEKLFFVVCSVLMFIDVTTSLMHINYKSISQMRRFQYRNEILILSDIILMAPVEIAFRGKTVSIGWQRLLIFFNFLRLTRLVRFIVRFVSSIGYTAVYFVVIKVLIVGILLVHTFACIWFYLGRYEAVTHNIGWAIKHDVPLRFPPISSDSTDMNYFISWYLMSMYFCSACLCTIGLGDITGTTEIEQWFCITITLCGYGTLTGIFLAEFITTVTQLYKHHSSFDKRLAIILKNIENEKLQDKVEKYYQAIWRETRAVLYPDLLRILPDSLLEELKYEIFKFPIKGCYVFEHCHKNILKKITSAMHMRHYLPSEILIKKAEINTNMIYIARGIVEILSDEDDESPVFYLRMGSILNLSSLFLIKPAATTVRAARYVMTYELSSRELYKVLRNYQTEYNQAIKSFQFVLDDATRMQDIRRKQKERAEFDITFKPFEFIKKEILADYRSIEQKLINRWIVQDEDLEEVDESETNILYRIVHNCKILKATPASIIYVPSQETMELEVDDACVHTKFPWVLEPSSQFMLIWDSIVLLSILLAAFAIPLEAAFTKYNSKGMVLVLSTIDTVAIANIFITMITVQEVVGKRVTTFLKIVSMKLQDPLFYLDIVAALPLYLLFPEPKNDALYRMNALINVRKIHLYFAKLQNAFMLDLTAVSILKYFIYFFMGSCWFGALTFMLACYPVNNCREVSWLKRIETIDSNSNPPQVRHEEPTIMSIYFGVLAISECAFGDVIATNCSEFVAFSIFFFGGTLLLIYLIADYSAALTLNNEGRTHYVNTVTSVLQYLRKKKISPSLEKRALTYFEMEWMDNKGLRVLSNNSIMWDAPKKLIKEVKVADYLEILLKDPLLEFFYKNKKKIIIDLCEHVQTVLIPPYEVVSHAGGMSSGFYIIKEGNCQLINLQGQVFKNLKKYDRINALEVLFGKPNLYDVKTVTHCRLIFISMKEILTILKYHQRVNLITQMDIVKTGILNHELGQALFGDQAIPVAVSEIIQEKELNLYSFTFEKGSPQQIMFLKPFTELGIFRVLRFIIVKKTVSPGGELLFWWEIQRSACAFLSGMIFPSLAFYNVVLPWLIYVAVALDVLAGIDLYFRCHVCYYDEQNLLIKHPLRTMIRYLKTSFTLDLIAMLPINYFLPPEYLTVQGTDWIRVSYPLADSIRMNRLLQMWRFIGFFSSLEEKVVRRKQIIIFIKYLLITVLILNIMALSLISFTLIFIKRGTELKMYVATPYKPWILMYDPLLTVTDLEGMFRVHVFAYLLISELALGVVCGDMTGQDKTEMIIICLVVCVGYLFFNYILAVLSNMRASLDLGITIYQTHMKHLVHYLRSENVSTSLQSSFIRHFEYVWSQTRGTTFACLTNFHKTLQEDCLMHLYKSGLAKTGIFHNLPEIVLREVCLIVEEKYFCSGIPIIQQNDIIDELYIVMKGNIRATKSMLSRTQYFLDYASVFGNFEDVRVRTVASFVTESPCLLLKMPSVKLHQLGSNFPILKKRLEILVLQKRFFIEPFLDSKNYDHGDYNEESKEKKRREKRVKRANYSSTVKWIMLNTAPGAAKGEALTFLNWIVDIISIFFHIYAVCFKVQYFYIILIFADFISITSLAVNFLTPYEDILTGEIIEDKKLIRKRYLRKGFFLDFFSTIPLYIFGFLPFVPKGKQYVVVSWLSINRLLRIVKVYEFITNNLNRLNVKVLLYKGFSIIFTLSLMTHACVSVWQLMRCTRYSTNYENIIECHSSFHGIKLTTCDDSTYECGLYFIVSLLTGTGYGDILPVDLPQKLYVISVIIISRFILAIFIGDLGNAVRTLNLTYHRVNFQYSLLKQYLHDHRVNKQVRNEILGFCESMWIMQKGVHSPDFLRETPRYLVEQLYMEIYGPHFKKNFLFVGCMDDFLRQMIVHISIVVYQPGNIVVSGGQVNDTFYAIHRGIVEAFDEDGEVVQTLQENSCFGNGQGLYQGLQHKYTYRVKSVSVILSLEQKRWLYLLSFFPSAKAEIYFRAKMLNLDP